MMKLGLSAPWYNYRNKLAALFNGDKEVEVSQLISTGKGGYKIDITVDNAEKACALNDLLISKVKMGNITVSVNILVPNGKVAASQADEVDLESAFEGNPQVSQILRLRDFTGTEWAFVMFKKSCAIAQFYNDDISDPYGNFNGLLSDIAREVTVTLTAVNYSVDIQ